MENILKRQSQQSIFLSDSILPQSCLSHCCQERPMMGTKIKTIDIEYGQYINPFHETKPGSTILIPKPGSSKIPSAANRMQSLFDNHYDKIVELIDNPPKDINDYDWGGTRIQAGRFMIKLESNDEGGANCWKEIMKIDDVTGAPMKSIITEAKRLANIEKTKSHRKYHNFYLIVSSVRDQQEVHIDTIKANHQYGMPLSHGVDSTIIYDVNKINSENRVTSMQKLSDLFSIPNYFFPQKQPTQSLLKAIHEINNASSVGKEVSEFGMLFNIPNTSHIKEMKEHLNKAHHCYFDYESFYTTNCSPGTCSSIAGGIAHAGSGSHEAMIRILMFWTAYYSTNPQEKYNSDEQITKLTIIIAITLYLWPTFEDNNKLQQRYGLICLINFFLFHSNALYKKTAPNHFLHIPFIYNIILNEMLQIMKPRPKYNTFDSKKFKEMAIKFAKVDLDVNNSDLYPTNEYKKQKTDDDFTDDENIII